MPTSYAVFQRTPDGSWGELPGPVEASGSESAARRAAERQGTAGEYWAVPTRSYSPVKVAFEKVPRTVVTQIDMASPSRYEKEPVPA